ncbi:hypothetical protein THICB1_100507 [Thiomonas arsenitoxydans]|uniref:Uncharacterized protein n=1 Tax=Thiomonas arsenitoxydans (strain DSM 22701 / CIP 110005 / 3As) TaxID=426114 RepID=A0ABM9T0U0_THIA3|nr:hypothetical protein THICB1_100507 [Thiomonas arsenitoxydans]CQR32819.1 hypothetical protein THICB6_160305 [Thiomonas arsenitoxydans]
MRNCLKLTCIMSDPLCIAFYLWFLF